MTILFSDDTLIHKNGKCILFSKFWVENGRKVGIVDNGGMKYKFSCFHK